jgi:hypothetical protein
MERLTPFPDEQRTITRQRSSWSRFIAFFAVVLFSNLLPVGLAPAAEDQSYQALRNWIEQYRPVPPTFAPGQHLTETDRKALEPFIPQSAWEYYFFAGMDMEIAATGQYLPLPEWGQNVKPGYQLDENGVLIGFTGGGFPFPEINPEDPQPAVKVIWNMLWRPGADDYNMPMVTWLRGPNGQLDRELEFVSVNTRYAQGEHCLVPGYEEVKTKSLMEFRAPRDMAGTKNLPCFL